MNIKYMSLLIILCFFFGCDDYSSPSKNMGLDDKEPLYYMNQYDPIADVGQYVLPEMKTKPKKYWSCVEVLGVGSRNNLQEKEKIRGLQYHLMCQSMAGLINKSVDENKSEIAVWLHDHQGRESYKKSIDALKGLGIQEQGMQSGIELARNNYGASDGVHIQIKDYFDGYVLTDVENNPESNMVGTIASHVYNGIIVDKRDVEFYEEVGYKMLYDASNKSTKDAWNEFKDQCSNSALVVMPVQTGELREFVIKNNLFILNINKVKDNPQAGQNLDLFEEVMDWLEPGAPILGWESGVSEDVFVNRASKKGHLWIPSDWIYNTALTSFNYKSRQESILAHVNNPQFIDFNKKKNYVSFYLSDGDNVQWMMNDFSSKYYENVNVSEMKMGFGLPIGNLSMVSPSQFSSIISNQNQECTLIESLGGGYLYADNFGVEANRAESLKRIAESVSASMKQHRIKILGLIAQDVKSKSALEGFQAYVDANDQLEGIVAIQYSPYAGGEGDIYWVKNKKGFHIPVVTVKYSLWNFGDRNTDREGTPAYIASKLKKEVDQDSFSLISVHAWSKFQDIGSSNDELAENNDGSLYGASAAKLCMNHLDDSFEVINTQELIWRIRMHYYPEETKEYLNTYF